MHTIFTLIIVVAWMLLLGWGFHALWRSHLSLDEELSEHESALLRERDARSHAERALAGARSALQRLARQQEGVRETERQRIGRDIHDDLGQHLLALKIDLSLLQVSTSGAHPAIASKLGAMLNSLDLTIRSLRTIINDLRPPALQAGLAAAIEWQLAEFSRINGIAHVLDTEHACCADAPNAQRDAAVFRILQESLTNIVRHAHASEVRVSLQRRAQILTLTVRDNGVGMPNGVPLRGAGIIGIRDRMLALGGRFAIDSQHGRGTVLTLSFPLTETVDMQ